MSSSDEELEIPDFDQELSDSEDESSKKNDESAISENDDCNENFDFEKQSEKLNRGSKRSLEEEALNDIQRYMLFLSVKNNYKWKFNMFAHFSEMTKNQNRAATFPTMLWTEI